MKSIRKVLALAVHDACDIANELTGESINALPEYFMSVKVAEFIHDHFSTFTFSMEDTLHNLCKEASINYEEIDPEYRIEKTTRVDLVLRSKSTRKIKHIIEFKRHLHTTQIEKDIKRLAWLCVNSYADSGSMEKNFLVAITHRKAELFYKRHEDILFWAGEISSDIDVKFEPVDLSNFVSSHPKGIGRNLFGGIWELKVKE